MSSPANSFLIYGCKIEDVNGQYDLVRPGRYAKGRSYMLHQRDGLWTVSHSTRELCWGSNPSEFPNECRWKYKSPNAARVVPSSMKVVRVNQQEENRRSTQATRSVSILSPQVPPAPSPITTTTSQSLSPQPPAPPTPPAVASRPITRNKATKPPEAVTTKTNTSAMSLRLSVEKTHEKTIVELLEQVHNLRVEIAAVRKENDSHAAQLTSATAALTEQVASLNAEKVALQHKLNAATDKNRETLHPLALELVRVRAELLSAEKVALEQQEMIVRLEQQVKTLQESAQSKECGTSLGAEVPNSDY